MYNDLRSLAGEVCPIGCIGHSVVELVARVHVDLEIWADRGLDAGIQARLHIHTHIFVFVGGAQLLVQLAVVWRIDSFDVLSVHSGRSGACTHGCFTSV